MAQERLDDAEGYRLTVFATNARKGQLQTLRTASPPTRPVRGPDPLREDAGMPNLPLRTLAQNAVWLQIVAHAADLLAWFGVAGLEVGSIRVWEAERLRPCLFTARP